MAQGAGKEKDCSPSSKMDALPAEAAKPLTQNKLRKAKPSSQLRTVLCVLMPVLVGSLPFVSLLGWWLSSPGSSHAATPKAPCRPADVPAGVEARCLDETLGFPLVLSPADGAEAVRSLEDLAAWILTNRDVVQRWLPIYGAVLMRGFAASVDTIGSEPASGPPPSAAVQFERVASQLAKAMEREGQAPPRLAEFYLGTSPRAPVNGTRHVFTASEFEPWKVHGSPAAALLTSCSLHPALCSLLPAAYSATRAFGTSTPSLDAAPSVTCTISAPTTPDLAPVPAVPLSAPPTHGLAPVPGVPLSAPPAPGLASPPLRSRVSRLRSSKPHL